jgi:hypothetical protein
MTGLPLGSQALSLTFEQVVCGYTGTHPVDSEMSEILPQFAPRGKDDIVYVIDERQRADDALAAPCLGILIVKM